MPGFRRLNSSDRAEKTSAAKAAEIFLRPAKAGTRRTISRGNELEKEENHEDQAKKSVGRMPRHQEPKKDVISCEKPRGGANIH